MRFWDSSAVVHLVAEQEGTAATKAALEDDPDVVVWWSTRVEVESALARLEREGALTPQEATQSARQLWAYLARWGEVVPSDAVRHEACRQLRMHSLRASDSLQLAAAVTAAEGDAASLAFVCFDDRLRTAAAREGFDVLPA